MRPTRDWLLDKALQRRAWGWLRRASAYVLGGGLGLIAAGAASVSVDHPQAKLIVWAVTLVALLLLWGAGAWAWETFKARRSAAGRRAVTPGCLDASAVGGGSAGQDSVDTDDTEERPRKGAGTRDDPFR